MTGITFADFIADVWTAACFDRCAPTTQRRVESLLRTQLVPEFGPLDLSRITPQRVHAWFDRYSLAAPAGANRALDVLAQVLGHAVLRGDLPTNPARGVCRNPGRRATRFLTRAEIGRLHAALDAHRPRGTGAQQADIIRLLLLTGCRKSEIIALRWAEVDGDRLLLRHAKAGPRTVFLSNEAQAIVARQRRTGAFVFPAADDPARHRSLELSLWRKVRRTAGLEGVRLHDLRHTFASHAVMAGVPLPVVSQLLGHAQLRMTLRYAHVSDRETEAAAERIGTAISAVLAAG